MAKKSGKSKDEQKVRKVGRPKKRGRKKKYYKPKSKSKSKKIKKTYSHNVTYNRVRQVIWENYKEDFPSYRVFIANKLDANGNKIKGSSIVSLVFKECKSLDCNDDDILAIYRQLRGQSKDEDVPLVPDDYFEPRGYWELLTTNFWDGMDERLWVVSPMLLIDPDYFLGILGEDRYVNDKGEPISYEEFKKNENDSRVLLGKKYRFQEFINYGNELQLQKLLEGSDSVPHFRFAGQTDDEEDRQAYWNELLKRWEIRVVIITPNNEIEDYGFNPSEPDEPIDEDLINQIKTKVPTVKITEPTPSGDKEVELEKAKAETKKAEAEIEKAKAEQEKAKAEDTKLKAQMKVIELFAEGKISEKKMDELLAKFK